MQCRVGVAGAQIERSLVHSGPAPRERAWESLAGCLNGIERYTLGHAPPRRRTGRLAAASAWDQEEWRGRAFPVAITAGKAARRGTSARDMGSFRKTGQDLRTV